MGDTIETLLPDLESATEESQALVIGRTINFALQSGWISQEQYDRAWRLIEAGGYIDAALTLVPDEWYWFVDNQFKGSPAQAGMCVPNKDETLVSGEAETPVLALCIAALKARSEQLTAEDV